MKCCICDICGRSITKNNYNKHLQSHNNGKYDKLHSYRYSLDHDDLNCKFCGKLCKNKNSLVQHEIRCNANPNKIDTSKSFNNGNRPAWNKGLTKETDERVKVQVEHMKKTFAKTGGSFKGRYHSKQTIEKMKNNPNCGGLRIGSGRGKCGWYKGFYCRSTYELVYVIYNIDHNIKFYPCKRVYTYIWNNENRKYFPDFELEDGTIIEVKGYSNKQTLAKLQAVTDRPLQVLYRKDLDYAFDYVAQNYIYEKLTDLYDK